MARRQTIQTRPKNDAQSGPAGLSKRTVRRSSLRLTLFFETFALLILTILLMSGVAFFLGEHEITARETSQLQSIAQEKATLFDTAVAREREQLSILGRDPTLRSLPSVTALVGFRQLLRVKGKSIDIVAGLGRPRISDEELMQFADAEGTMFSPILTDVGWSSYVIATPQFDHSVRTGTLIAIFDASVLASRILHAEYLGETGEVVLAIGSASGDHLLLHGDNAGRAVLVQESTEGKISFDVHALRSEQGVIRTQDYAGIPVLAAYRQVPSVGWTVIAKMDAYEVTSSIIRFAGNLAGAGLLLVALLSLSTFILSRRIIEPLEDLVAKLDGLESKKWIFKRSIFTGNELEVVDSAALDLTERLRKAHDHLEDLVRERTGDLQKQLAEDAAILRSMEHGLLVTDKDGRVVYMNRAAELLTGYEQVLGNQVLSVLPLLTKDGIEVAEELHPVTHVLLTRESFHPKNDPEFTLQRKDGTVTALQISCTPILQGSVCSGTVIVIRDSTDERLIDTMKSEFITLVSHQLRTPLSAMRWYLEMLSGKDAGPLTLEQQECVAQVTASNARMVHLVNALLNVSRMELGTFQLSAEPIGLGEVFKDAVHSLKRELKEKNISIADAYGTNSVSVRSDRGLLQLVIENLLSNAIKYSLKDASVTLSAENDTAHRNVIIRITDSGIGIPEAEQAQIGHKLFRAANAKAIDTDGNGLGLYISRVASETMGAELTFLSKAGKGTTFVLRIPVEPTGREKNPS